MNNPQSTYTATEIRDFDFRSDSPLEIRFRIKIRTVILAIVFLFSFWRVWAVFAPNSYYVSFNSDSAFTILMPNQDRPITLFDYYSYARDRWGAFTFLLARLVHQWTGYHWSIRSMHFYRTGWLFGGLLILTALVPRARVVVLMAALIAMCVPAITRWNMFDLSELYSWQIPGLMAGWLLMRRIFSLTHKQPSIQTALWFFGFFAVSFLTIWTSLASGPLFCFLLALESVRSVFANARSAKLRYAIAFGLIMLGIGAEKLLRMYYHRFCLKRYGSEFKTDMSFDVGYLLQNLKAQVNVVFSFPWWPILLFPLLLFVGVACMFVYLRLRQRNSALQRLKAMAMDDVFILICGMWGMGLINFVMAVVIAHVRWNSYSNRFLTLTFVFGVASGLLTLFMICRDLPSNIEIRRYAAAGFTAALILFFAARLPSWRLNQQFRMDNETAHALLEKAPDATVMGSYWCTYVMGALQGTTPMLTVPLEGQDVRMPWTRGMLRDTRRAVVEYRFSNLATSGVVPPVITEYGTSFRLLNANWYANGDYAFALYEVEKQ